MEFHVVYISDDNFASKLGISLLSMFEHNLDLQIVVHILDMGIDVYLQMVQQESRVSIATKL